MQIKRYKGVDPLPVQAVFIFYGKQLQKRLAVIVLLSALFHIAAIRFRWRSLYYYLGLQGAE